jgi:hypothetical protein
MPSQLREFECSALDRLRIHYVALVRESFEEFIKNAAVIDIALLSDLLFHSYDHEQGDLAGRMLDRLGFGYKGAHSPGNTEVKAIPDGLRYEIVVRGIDGEESSLDVLQTLTRFEIEELTQHLVWLRGGSRAETPAPPEEQSDERAEDENTEAANA